MLRQGKKGETLARRALEDQGFIVSDANILFGTNCPNIDLVFYDVSGGRYIQVKSSEKPAGKDSVVVDGSPWTEDQLYNDVPIFNKHTDHFRAEWVIIVDFMKDNQIHFYIAPIDVLESILRERGRAWAETPKRDGERRSLGFRKELARGDLAPWLNAWEYLKR